MPRLPRTRNVGMEGVQMIEDTVGKSLVEALSRVSANGIFVGITLFVVGIPVAAVLIIAALRNMLARGS